jgi:hypothetical protein
LHSFTYRRLLTVSYTTPSPTELINFKVQKLKRLKFHYIFRLTWPSSGVKNISSNEEKAAFFVAANTYAGPSNAHVCWSWCVVLLLCCICISSQQQKAAFSLLDDIFLTPDDDHTSGNM